MEKLTGGLRYCKMENCKNTTHPEDNNFPFCELHEYATIPYLEYQKSHKEVLAIFNELK